MSRTSSLQVKSAMPAMQCGSRAQGRGPSAVQWSYRDMQGGLRRTCVLGAWGPCYSRPQQGQCNCMATPLDS